MSFDIMVSRGRPDYATSSDPAANAEASITVPAGSTWIIMCAHLTVAQGATQTPLPQLQIATSAGTVIGLYPGASAAQSASVTSTYDWYEGATLTAGAGATSNRSPIPRGLSVKGGMVISTVTTGKGANTDLSALTLHVIAL
jgi:hypothetical protein